MSRVGDIVYQHRAAVALVHPGIGAVRLRQRHEEHHIARLRLNVTHQTHLLVARGGIPRLVTARHADESAVLRVHIAQLPGRVYCLAIGAAVLHGVIVGGYCRLGAAMQEVAGRPLYITDSPVGAQGQGETAAHHPIHALHHRRMRDHLAKRFAVGMGQLEETAQYTAQRR